MVGLSLMHFYEAVGQICRAMTQANFVSLVSYRRKIKEGLHLFIYVLIISTNCDGDSLKANKLLYFSTFIYLFIFPGRSFKCLFSFLIEPSVSFKYYYAMYICSMISSVKWRQIKLMPFLTWQGI